jgi:predicted enzyme related to lactoylglutathione lyase
MTFAAGNPFVHLELRTDNVARACAFYTALFGWRVETVRDPSGSYLVLEPGSGIEGGAIEVEVERPTWLPYVEVGDIARMTCRAQRLGGPRFCSGQPRAPRGGAASSRCPPVRRLRCGSRRHEPRAGRAWRVGRGRRIKG